MIRCGCPGLDALGDVGKAATAVHVHPHLRYRLRRVSEIGEFDLDDPEPSFATMLELRMTS